MQSCWIICVLFYLQLLTIGKARNLCHMAKDLNNNEECVQVGNNHYVVNGQDKLTWFEAESKCREHGRWSLFDWKNEEDYNAMIQYLNTHATSSIYWTTYNDRESEGDFRSVATGEPIRFAKFREAQPDNWEGNENCIHINKKYSPDFTLNDIDCNKTYPYICRYHSA